MSIRLAFGLAYKDLKVTVGKKYLYELRGVLADGKEVLLATGVFVQAGKYKLPEPPSGLTLESGDRKVLATWNRNPYSFSYRICRSLHATIDYQIIHDEKIQLDIEYDLQGNK